MYRHFQIFLMALLGNSIVSSSNELNLSLCMTNQTVSIQIKISPYNDDLTCTCQADLMNYAVPKEDYVHTPVGSFKFHTNAKTWNEARKICNEENAHLAIINSYAEEAVLVEMLLKQRKNIRNAANKEEAYLGLHDIFNEGEWLTIFGESIYATGYTNWSTTYSPVGGQPDNKDNNQDCAALIYQSRMDDVNCHERFAFFCELPLSCAV